MNPPKAALSEASTGAGGNVSRLARRHVLSFGLLVLLTPTILSSGALLSSGEALSQEKYDNGQISVQRAHVLASNGKIKLVDIRWPAEWKQTGVGKGAHGISMHEKGFVSQLDKLTGGDRSKPIALICARGNRSNRMKAKLNAAGFTNIINVPEGMLGSSAGPGWLGRKLPLN